MSSAVPTSNYVTYYDPAKTHHRAWLQAVLDRLMALDPSSLVEGSELRNLWKAAVASKAPVTAAAGPAPAVAIALPLIKEFEGCRLKADPDPASGDELFTIGWGCTSYGDDRRMQAGDAISQEQADTLLVARLQKDLTVLEATIPASESSSPHQQAALLSLSFNCGTQWFRAKGLATLSTCLRQAQLAEGSAAFLARIGALGFDP